MTPPFPSLARRVGMATSATLVVYFLPVALSIRCSTFSNRLSTNSFYTRIRTINSRHLERYASVAPFSAFPSDL